MRLGLIVLVAALPATAAAQSGEELERAKASFQAGATAYAAGEYLAAIQALEAAYALSPAPAIAFSLAQAERRQYFVAHERPHLDRAITLYRRYVEQVPSGGRRADALDALAQLEPLAAALATAAPPASAADGTRPARLVITAEAPGARLALDGDAPVPSPLIREVAPGKHRVRASADGFFPEERELTAVAGELIPAVVVLRERLGLVAVTAPADAEVYLDGVFHRHGPLTVELPSGPHRLTVAQRGHRLSTRVLQVERGRAQEVAVTLAPTPQRRLARLLLLGSAIPLAAGVVFGVAAKLEEDRAQDVLARRARDNVSSADLGRYQDAVAARNHLRVASIASLAVTAAGLLTALALHVVDYPDPEAIHAAGPLASSRWHLALGPATGLALGAVF